MDDDACIFCDIVAGRVAASVVFQDDATIAFVDLRQPTSGHVLVVPKQHVEFVYDLRLEVAARLMQSVVRVTRAMRQTLTLAGLSVWQSNGSAADQEVPHVHMHLLVRQPGDHLLQDYPTKPLYPNRETLDQVAALIRTGFEDS